MKVHRCPACGRREKRSNPANARYWLLLHAIAEKVRPDGRIYSADTWHQWAKSKWLGCNDVTLPNGKILTIPRSSAALDISEFNEYMGRVEAWATERDVFLDEIENAA